MAVFQVQCKCWVRWFPGSFLPPFLPEDNVWISGTVFLWARCPSATQLCQSSEGLAQMSQRDHETLQVSWNHVNCCTTLR